MLYELNAARALLPEGGVIISDDVFRYQLLGYVPALAAHLSLLGRRSVHQA